MKRTRYFACMRDARMPLSLVAAVLIGCCCAQTAGPYFERVLADELPGARILALAEDPWGAIWVGTSNGVGRIVGDQVRIWRQSPTDSASLSANEIRSIDASDSVRIWVGTTRGLCSIDPISGVVQRHPFRIQGEATEGMDEIWQVALGDEGVLWVSLNKGLACFNTQSQDWTWPAVEQGQYPGERFRSVPNALTWDRARHVLWAGTKNGLYRVPGSAADGTGTPVRLEPFQIGTHVSCLALDSDGRLWMNDAERLALSMLDVRTNELRQMDLPPGMDEGSMNRSLLVDAAGGIWLAGNDDALYWRGSGAAQWTMLTYDARQRWSPENSSVNALLQGRTGVVWLGTEEGLLRVAPLHAAQEVLAVWESPRSITRVRSMGDTLLLATNGLGILRYDRSRRRFIDTLALGRAHDARTKPGIISDMVTDLTLIDGRLLIGTKSGIRYWPEPGGGGIPGLMPSESRPRFKNITHVALDARGTSWVLTYNHGLWMQSAQDPEPKQLQFRAGQVQMTDRISALAIHPDGGVVCGTTTGRFMRVGPDGELVGAPLDCARGAAAVTALCVVDGNGAWIGLDDGRLLYFATGSDVAREWSETTGLPGGAIRDITPHAAHGVVIRSDAGLANVRTDGTVERVALLGLWGRPMAILVDTEGALLVACSKAIVRVRVEQGPSPDATRPAIAAVLSGGQHLPVHPFRSVLEVPFERRSLSLRVSSLGAALPERALLRYRLNPDRPWVELGAARAIDLPDLREGNYLIEVALLTAQSPTATLRLRIHPPWYRSTAFILAAVLLAVSALALAIRAWFRRKLRTEQERSSREKARLEERIRIAHDLHDDLGSGLALIAMEGEMARMDEHADPRDALRRMSEGTRDITDSMRRIVWALGSGQDTLGDLVAYIRSSAAELMDRAEIRLESEALMAEPQRKLSADQRRHLLLISKELLLNVVKHAHAKSVRLNLVEQGDELLITVADDGVGFDTRTRMGSGTGMQSIANRVVSLGGAWNLRSVKGDGTIAEVRVRMTEQPV